MSILPPAVFISYHRRTPAAMALAEQLYDVVLEHGSRPFLDHRNIDHGDDWADRIYTELFACDAAIILISRAGIERSQWLRHEAGVLAGRSLRWHDTVLMPVLLDIAVEELDSDPQLRGLARVQCVRSDQEGPLVGDIVAALTAQWQRFGPRLKRRRFYQALLGVSRRARDFRTQIECLMPTDSVLLGRAIERAGLPLPPTDAHVLLHRYAAGLLLSVDRPGEFLAQLTALGAADAATRLEGHLGPRGLLPQRNRVAWSLTRRFFWSLRASLVAGVVVSLVLAVVLVWASAEEQGIAMRVSAMGRALLLVGPPTLILGTGLTVVLRWLLFTFAPAGADGGA